MQGMMPTLVATNPCMLYNHANDIILVAPGNFAG